jgi:hypothetical protein
MALMRDTGLAALGSFAMAVIERFREIKDENRNDGEKVFSDVARAATAEGAKLYLNHLQAKLKGAQELIDHVIHEVPGKTRK